MQKINDAALALIESAEGFVDHWYPDPAHGWKVPTVCFGHTDSAGEPKYASSKTRKFTKAEGREILRADLSSYAASVQSLVTVPINENQFGALVSFTFNLGAGNLKKSTLLKKLNAGDYEGAASQFRVWNRAAGKVLKGLTTRRENEAKLFLTPVKLPKAEPIIPIQEKPMEEFETPLAEPSKAITFNWFPWALGAVVIGIVLWLFFNLRF